eukprot:SAG11_NODE_814_length_7033_cov_57.557254_5_plen_62_part_00
MITIQSRLRLGTQEAKVRAELDLSKREADLHRKQVLLLEKELKSTRAKVRRRRPPRSLRRG